MVSHHTLRDKEHTAIFIAVCRQRNDVRIDKDLLTFDRQCLLRVIGNNGLLLRRMSHLCKNGGSSLKKYFSNFIS